MNILCLGASYTGINLAVNFFQHRVFFVSRRNVYKKDRLQNLQKWISIHGELDGVLDTIPCWQNSKESTNMEQDCRPIYWTELQELKKLQRPIPFVHISSTGVYQDADSRAIVRHEDGSQLYSSTARSQRRFKLENMIREKIGKELGYPVVIIRSSAIYGPQRNVLYRIHNEKKLSRAFLGNKIVSRIHVYDLCRIILKVIRDFKNCPSLFHATDNNPVSYMKLFSHVEKKYSIEIPGNWRSGKPYGKIILGEICSRIIGEYCFENILKPGALDAKL